MENEKNCQNINWLFFWQNYNISPLSLPCVRNWFLKFQGSIISPLSFKTKLC